MNEIICIFVPIMEKLYIFNPETDLALAANTLFYTPPINIKRLKECYALLPALYATPGSFIIIPDNFNINDSPQNLVELVNVKRLNLINYSNLKDRSFEVNVWGWNKSIRNQLLKFGINKDCLPTESYLEKLREISHRRTTIEIQQRLRHVILDYDIDLPIEFFDENEAFLWASENIGAYMKAPWSSSGRGIYQAIEPYNKSMQQWIHGIVDKQGSIIGEIGLKRDLDFATEWYVENGKASFLGFSIFDVANHGLYKGNYLASNNDLRDIIISKSNRWTDKYLLILEGIINEVISPFYNGPIGIDMLISDTQRINLCVEVNLRMTMGHVAIEIWNQNKKKGFMSI